MATTPWGLIIDDVVARIAGDSDGDPAGITPTVDPTQRWRYGGRARPPAEPSRDRYFVIPTAWTPVENVQVFGGGEDQLGRDITIETYYAATDEYEDRRHGDEQDLVAALEPQDTYPSGSGWALRYRRVLRDKSPGGERLDSGAIRTAWLVRLIWREPTSHV